MDTLGYVQLGDRRFPVRSASIDLDGAGMCFLEINTENLVFDGENWQPFLYHQGMEVERNSLQELSGFSTSWRKNSGPDYPHPEPSLIYVFGHHDVYDCEVSFGKVEKDKIAITWVGKCDVFWQEPYGEAVSLRCECMATLAGA